MAFNLSAIELKLYRLLAVLFAGSFLMGLLWALLGSGSDLDSGLDDWHATPAPAAIDTVQLYAQASAQPRWFSQKASVANSLPEIDPAIALEGKPESLRLTAVITRAGQTYALFYSTIPLAKGQSRVIQVTQGDHLIGDWKVTAIAKGVVDIAQGELKQKLRLYPRADLPKGNQ